MQRISVLILIIIGSAMTFVSCSKEDTNAGNPDGSGNTAAGPQDTVTTFMVYFTSTADSTTEVGSYDDPDGPGPKPGNIGGVALMKNTTYIVTFMIEDATAPGAKVFLHNKIKNNGSDYKICISNPLNMTVNPVDSDGKFPIGLENDLITTSTTGNSNMNFTVKYQKSVKNGQCDPGSVYFTCNIPVSVL